MVVTRNDIARLIAEISSERDAALVRFKPGFILPPQWEAKYEEELDLAGKGANLQRIERELSNLLTQLARIQRAYFRKCPDHFRRVIVKLQESYSDSEMRAFCAAVAQIEATIESGFTLDEAAVLFQSAHQALSVLMIKKKRTRPAEPAVDPADDPIAKAAALAKAKKNGLAKIEEEKAVPPKSTDPDRGRIGFIM